MKTALFPVSPRLAFACALLAVGPASARAQVDPEQRRPGVRETTVGAEYSYAYFEGDIDPWQLGALSVGYKRDAGSIIGRLNVARRFATTGTQGEIDAYPSFGKNTYAYLNVGYSGSTVFPEWRFGGEVFRTLPRAFEASLGFRQLRFGGSPVTLFTGAIGRYSGNYWYSFRPFLRDKPTGLSASGNVTARRYFADADNFIGARAGYGTTPSDDVLAAQLTRANSLSTGLYGSRTVAPRTIGIWALTFEREEITADTFRNRWEIGGGIKLRY